MKTITTIIIILLVGCASAPTPPNLTQLMLDSVDRVRTGRAGTGPTADQVNQACVDYDKARQEYENSASYKLKVLAITPLILIGSAAADVPYYGGYYSSYRYQPGKTVVTTSPISGGAYQSIIKYYK